jgi:hypothetical protein
MNDLELLRTYEPVVRYTKGEMFFPSAVDEFVKGSSLWMVDKKGETRLLAQTGVLDVDKIARYADVPAGCTYYLSYAGEPLDALQYQRWLMRKDRESFLAAGRLARVPLLSRVGDSLFDLSLMLRGTVPGAIGAAADLKYKTMQQQDNRRVYYGRVLREGGWIILHYLFFFTMNNWRSSFYGANDHESDWEQIFVYLYQPEGDETGRPAPLWVAYASHDFHGDDLRRRWDDPILTKEGTHPVIFAGAGSHASYFQPGEYVMGATPRFLVPVKKGAVWLRKFWVEQLGQGSGDTVEEAVGNAVSVPFVDYARGDGKRIGPGQDEEWTPILISDEVGWVDGYRGLWGLDTRDPFGGERAPAGPKYNRDGSVRHSWYDPLGWAGLDKVYPPQDVQVELEARLDKLAHEESELAAEIQRQRRQVRELALDVDALRATEYHSTLHEARETELEQQQAKLHALQADLTENRETQKAVRAYRARVLKGDWGPPAAHIRHAHPPAPPLPAQHRLVEIWAAISGAVALLIFVALLIWRPDNWVFWTVVVGILFGAVEAATRGRIANFMLTTVVVLALAAVLILFFEFWRWILIIGLMAVVIYMIRDNLRELARN